MNWQIAAGLVAAAVVATTASADSVDISGVVGASSEQTGATYSGSLFYDFVGGSTGELTVSLTNDSPASVGGFLTGFVFRATALDGASLTSSSVSSMTSTGAEAANPFGMFDGGAALRGKFLGGGKPSDGLGIGQSGVFVFSVTSSHASSLSAHDFLGSLGEPGFVVRFRGLEDGGSDKVPGGTFEVVVPLPGAGAMALVGLTAVSVRRRR